MDHYRHPRNRGELNDADVVRRGSNPRCGDEIEIGVNFAADHLQRVRFRGRGCSVCLASASMLTEAATGQSRQQARQLVQAMQAWFDERGGPPVEGLKALEAVRNNSARKRCVLLAWEALNDALAAE